MKLIWLLIIANVFMSCQKDLEQSFNDERQKMNIPIIPDSWEREQVYSDVTRWRKPSHKTDTINQGYSMKTVSVLEADRIKEEDFYFGPSSIITQDVSSLNSSPSLNQLRTNNNLSAIRIEYYYSYHNGEWKIDSTLSSIGDRGSNHSSKNDLSDAEKTLLKWKMTRLNY